MDERYFRVLFSELLKGYSVLLLEDEQYKIRHLDYHITAGVEALYRKLYLEAVEQGIPTEKDRLGELKKTGEWTDKDEAKIEAHKRQISSLEKAKQTAYLESQMVIQNRRLKEEKSVLRAVLGQKRKLIGVTAEFLANKRSDSEYLFLSIHYNDKQFFDRKTFEDLNEQEYQKWHSNYTLATEKFHHKNIEKLALLPFLQSLYDLSNKNVMEFYGKPVVELTVYQEELLKYAGYFNHILHETHPPEELLEKPQELIDWFTTGRNLKNVQSASGGGSNRTIIGATGKDMAKLGQGGPDLSYLDKAKSEGKTGFALKDLMQAGAIPINKK